MTKISPQDHYQAIIVEFFKISIKSIKTTKPKMKLKMPKKMKN